jgi:hypothetical protein
VREAAIASVVRNIFARQAEQGNKERGANRDSNARVEGEMKWRGGMLELKGLGDGIKEGRNIFTTLTRRASDANFHPPSSGRNVAREASHNGRPYLAF